MDPRQLPTQGSAARPIQSQRNSLPDIRNPNGASGFPAANGPMPVPSRPPGINENHTMYGPRGVTNGSGGNGFMSKSPPSAPSQKNTKHVPCKFFYKGQCAAGDTCPYSHAPEPPEPCKFFINGNCKYGNNCALPHYGPNGMLLNPSCFSTYRRDSFRRSRPQHTRPSAFTANGNMNGNANDIYMQSCPPQVPLDRHMPYRPEQDGEFGSPPGSTFGSPPFESQLPRSPPFRTALDAPLPASFSSQDLPNIQKFGPNATSVPANGGLGPLAAASPTSSTVSRDAFVRIDTTVTEGVEKLDLGSSPPDTRAEVAPRRINSNGRLTLGREFPASLPIREPHDMFRGLDRQVPYEDGNHEEDFLPSALSDLLTPQEKMRRFSRSQDDPGVPGRPSQNPQVGSPNSKVGSPTGASPSRFSGFFAEQAKRDASAQLGSSPFGHVGSPLRNSSFPSHVKKSPEVGGTSPSFGPISPPGFKERPGGVSSLSEQLRKERSPAESQAPAREPATQAAAAPASRPSGTPAVAMRKERVPTGAGGPERIDEEDACFFSMEEEKAQ